MWYTCYMFIFSIISAAAMLLAVKGLHFPLAHAIQPVAIGGFIMAIAVARPHFAPMLKGLAFLVVFTAFYGVLLDACTAHYTRTYDEYLIAADAMLGFDVTNMPKGGLLMSVAYWSLVPQMMAAIWFLTDNQQVFLRRFAVCLIVGAVAMLLFPCRGNYTGDHGLETIAGHFDSLKTASVVSWVTAQGTLTFPSIHTAAAVLLIAGFWKTRLALPVIILNGFMIYSCIPVGRHYVVDLIAGAALALITIIFIKPEATDANTN